MYPEYKAHRKRISEDWDQIFKVQFPIIKRILRNLGIVYVWDNKGSMKWKVMITLHCFIKELLISSILIIIR